MIGVGVLGSAQVVRGEEVVEPGARRVRSVLAALAMDSGALVSADRLVDLVWGEAAPRGAHGTLHSYISGLRRMLEPELAPRSRPTILITTDDGYRLQLDRRAVDAADFADRVRTVHRGVAVLATQLSTGPDPAWPDRSTTAAALEELESALDLWRGQPYAELADHPDALAARARLDELRLTAEEDRALVMLALGDHAGVVAATEQATGRNPFRERIWALHALALTRSGRQADALEALRRIRQALADELGLDPGPELQDLEQAVLRQDLAILQTLPADPVAAVPGGTRVPMSWQAVGRERERAMLGGVLHDAAAGRPSYGLLVGEPGMGKSRLSAELMTTAADAGMTVALGRCSQDDGAPPLWPWVEMLESVSGSGQSEVDLIGMGSRLRRQQHDDAELAFEAAHRLASFVRDRSRRGPLLLIFDDAQWADSATLRAVTHLVGSATGGDRLAVVITRRSAPVPVGALADLEVVLARHHAQRIELGGLGLAEAADLVRSVAPEADSAEYVASWHAATEGNPFFLVELARLAAEREGWQGQVPPSVQVVVRQRLEHLPAATREALVLAGALGREFSTAMLAAVSGLDPWAADGLLDPARDAGIVRDGDAGRVRFEHALTRDAVLATVYPSQLARTHARIAYALTRPDAPVPPASQPFELARHWLAAGPVHVSEAWRAAVAAARRAREEFANDEAVELLAAAVEAQRQDLTVITHERYELLLDLAEVASYAGRWERVVPSAVEAIGLAVVDADPSRVARAAEALTRHSVWLPQSYLEVPDDLVEDLRRALLEVDPGHAADRVRLELALACQLYYAAGREDEISALVDRAMAAARRLGDPALLRWAAHTATLALWRPRFLAERRSLTREALEAARLAGDQDGEALALGTAAGIAVEQGDRDEYELWAPLASALAERRRLGYLRLVLEIIELNLAALRRSAELDRLHVSVTEIAARSVTPVEATTLMAGVDFMVGLWRPDNLRVMVGEMARLMEQVGDPMVAEALSVGYTRLLRRDDLRRMLDRLPLPVAEYWAGTWDVAFRVEAAAVLGDRRTAAELAPLLRVWSGRITVSGISGVGGPVDGYLALAEAMSGDARAARAAADRAVALAQTWRLSAYLDWFARWRSDLGF